MVILFMVSFVFFAPPSFILALGQHALDGTAQSMDPRNVVEIWINLIM